MSERRANLPAQVFEIVPASAQKAQISQWRLLALGVIFPATVIGFELTTHFCAKALFDPIPTPWHALAVSFVPACNFLIWMRLRSGRAGSKWLAAGSGAAIAIGGFYALLFAPLMPVAVLAIMLYGIGFLPFAPLAGLCATFLLRRSFRKANAPDIYARHLWGGLSAGCALLLALDVSPIATQYGLQLATSSEPHEQQRGLWVLRHLGDENLLLRLCYDTSAKPMGLLSLPYNLGARNLLTTEELSRSRSADEVRNVYYRVYGAAFNSQPAPALSRRNPQMFWGPFDNDLGGVDVGGRIEGLDLASSRLDGSIQADHAVAYLEWTFEFKNRSNQDREVRLQLALPPKGVVSRATLWVDGEEREAAYGGRGETRAAYQNVVRQARDPLLITAKGPDRVLAQAFPAPRNGGTIKFKLGISAPLDLTDGRKARLVLPQIVERNFDLPQSAAHTLWIESRHRLSTTAPGLASHDVASGAYRIDGEITDRTLSESRKIIDVAWEPSAQPAISRIGDGEIVEQAVERETLAPPSAIMIVVDGSAHMKRAIPGILSALDALPMNAKAGLIIAGETVQELPLAPWTDDRKSTARQALQTAQFIGGQDNTPALAAAFNRLEPFGNAFVVWVHGAQPVRFRKGLAALERISRLKQLPKLVLYALEPGPNEALPDAPWAWSAVVLPQTQTPESDLAGFFQKLWRQDELHIVRRLVTDDKGEKKGSDHIARLWASEQVLSLLGSTKADSRTEAIALASQYRLVTAVSGAVVLQNAQQYAQNNLTPVAPGTVPAVPEPEEWALIIIVCAAMSWLMMQRRLRSRRTA